MAAQPQGAPLGAKSGQIYIRDADAKLTAVAPSPALSAPSCGMADPVAEGLDRHLEDRQAGMKPLATGQVKAAEPKHAIPRLVSLSNADATRRIISGLE